MYINRVDEIEIKKYYLIQLEQCNILTKHYSEKYHIKDKFQLFEAIINNVF